MTNYPISEGHSARAVREEDVERAALDWFAGLGWQALHGSYVAPDGPGEPRPDWRAVVLRPRLMAALAKLNPGLPQSACEAAARQIIADESQDPLENNRRFLKLLRDGVDVEVREGNAARTLKARLMDAADPLANDFLAVQQFTILGIDERRPDIIAFVNGLPLAVLELKDPANAGATLRSAFNQLQTYRARIPALFRFNAALIISDGLDARIGSLTAGLDRFAPWRTIDGASPSTALDLETLVRGVFDKAHFVELACFYQAYEIADGAAKGRIGFFALCHLISLYKG